MTLKTQAPFNSPYAHDFVRIAACVPEIRLADPAFNADRTLELVAEGDRRRVALMVFPELGVSAYSLDDLLLQDALLEAVEVQIGRIVEGSRGLFPAFVVGAPLRFDGRLYNTAIVIRDGAILGVTPKSFLPNYREFYEKRHFASGARVRGRSIRLADHEAPFGADLIFKAQGGVDFAFHVEICEDVWAPEPPSTLAALAGAEVLLNLSASNIAIGKAAARRLLCAAQSARCVAAYAYSNTGPGESTTDLAWDGHAAIFELGELAAEAPRFAREAVMTVSDIDVGRIRQERARVGTVADAANLAVERTAHFRTVTFDMAAPSDELTLEREIERFPFVPSNPAQLAEDCAEAYQIQMQGLVQRLKSSGVQKAVIGVSGGLDSTQALIVAARAMDALGLPRANVLAFTMPGFGTTEGTKSNAWALMRALDVTAAELDIRPAAEQMLGDIGHPYAAGKADYDVTFENVQAGLRTDYLFRLANHHGGLVVGTGDLSEAALGWSTYGVGDHMSHYNVNAAVPKTLIQHLIRYVANSAEVDAEAARVLFAVLDTEISPELVPQGDGAVQRTEDFVGPYSLQDFTLHYMIRWGFRPSKIAYLAWNAWGDVARGRWPENTPQDAFVAHDMATIKRWMGVFLKRFFQNQFKRSCVPNGPKISSAGALSPRGDWRMPSDAAADIWLADLERVPETL
ncbi:MAG: NAD(+) synthase [Brevundimonas sp.]|uniref:NAD(+) synthase n=1 Tax=Brevundimonas sp. TaxID=1871086 RepID=UPI001228B3A4|nr:NAD(+) synthase [Brevundimonas sp.]RZJ16401.1 MAG: NAD(+) synthase [Brevundimonas sp.]